MYFTKKKIAQLKKMITAKNKYDVYEIKLFVGEFNEDELTEIFDCMFLAWRKISVTRWQSYLKNYNGILRRFLIDFIPESGKYRPYFYLICVREKKIFSDEEVWKIKLENEKLRVQGYIKWLTAWVTAIQICTDVSISFSLVDLDRLEELLNNFCTNEKYTLLGKIDDAKKALYANALGKHKLVTGHGIFTEAYMNRHMSVER